MFTTIRTAARTCRRLALVGVLGASSAVTVAAVPVPAGADTATAVDLGPDFKPATSLDCGPGETILKYNGGDTFKSGRDESPEGSSGDPLYLASWGINGAANTLTLNSVTYLGTPLLVTSVVISGNGAGEAYEWSYTPASETPLVHTASSATPKINPMTSNGYFFVCAVSPTSGTKLTLNKMVSGGPRSASDFTLTATGPSTLSGLTGTTAFVLPGSYSLTESPTDPDYALTLSCMTSTGSVLSTTGGSVALTGGSSVTCTFTNTYVAVPEYTFSKSAPTYADTKTPTGPSAGDTLTYTLTLTNTGTVPLPNASITDPSIASLSCMLDDTPVSLTPTLSVPVGSALVCTGSMVLTQDQVDAGSASNTAEGCIVVAGVEDCTPDTEVHTFTPAAGIETAKNYVGTTYVSTEDPLMFEAGDTLRYEITATNTGATTLTGVLVTDPMPGVTVESMTGCTWPSAVGTLLPGQAVTCEATYVLTQDDLEAGTYSNTANACGTAPASAGLTAPTCDDDVEVVTLPQVRSILVDKTASPTGPVDIGDVITYTVTTTNTGNVAVTVASVVDPLVALACDRALTDALQPGQMLNCTAEYTVTAADADNGSVTNTATVCAMGIDPCPTDSVDVPVTQTPAFTVAKSANVETAKLGDTITYTIAVENTGNVTLTLPTPAINDPVCDADTLTLASGDADGDSKLDHNETWSFTCTSIVTQADVDASGVINVADVCPSFGAASLACTTGTDTVTIERIAKLTTDKTVTSIGDGVAPITAGEIVTYTITSKNDGNTTLSGISVVDNKIALQTLSCTWPLNGAGNETIGTLLPGQTVSCTATYVLTSADITAASLTNEAHVCGGVPDGIDAGSAPDFVDVCDDGVVTTPLENPGIDVEKSSTINDVDGDGLQEVGETITYTFTVTNTGNVALAVETPVDPKCDVGTIALTGGDSDVDAKLDTTETWLYSCIRTMLLADVNAGVDNTVQVCASSPAGVQVCDTDTINTKPVAKPSLVINKGPELQKVANGGTATFTISVTNTGNVTLTGVTVSDPATPSCDRTGVTLIPGQTLEYQCTLANVTGDFTNVATATGTGPNGEKPTDSDDAVVDSLPKLIITKTASATSVASGGTTTFTFSVKNLSSDPALNVVLTDTVFGNVGGLDRTGATGTEGGGALAWAITADACTAPATLAGGATYTCTVTVRFTVTGSATPVPVHRNVGVATVQDDDGNVSLEVNDDATVSVTWRGRTPGYWKNHTKSGQWPTPYAPSITVQSVFTVPTCLKNAQGNLDLGAKSRNGAADTLLAALNYQGNETMSGGAEILLRAAVAALLNEQFFAGAYPAASSTADLIAKVNTALASCDRATMISLATALDYWNNGVH